MATADAGNSATEYGKAILVDFRTGALYRPRSRGQCVADTDAMQPYGLINPLGRVVSAGGGSPGALTLAVRGGLWRRLPEQEEHRHCRVEPRKEQR